MSAVTIGIPVYNGERQIRLAVESSLAQTYPQLEVVISDNASSDRTARICQEYASNHNNVTFFSNQENLGASRNFNLVFERSSGDYFKWMGHDDVLAPTAIEKAVRVLDDDPSLAIAHWLERIVDGNGTLLREYEPSQGFEVRGGSASERFREMLHFRRKGYAGDPIYGLISRKALRRTRLLSNKHNPNYLLLEELAVVGGITTISEVLATRVYNDTRVTTWELLRWLDPHPTSTFPHFKRALEHSRIGLIIADSPTTERVHTVGSLILYHLSPRELKGFAWDLANLFRRSN